MKRLSESAGMTEYAFTKDEMEQAWELTKDNPDKGGRLNVMSLIFDLDINDERNREQISFWDDRLQRDKGFIPPQNSEVLRYTCSEAVL